MTRGSDLLRVPPPDWWPPRCPTRGVMRAACWRMSAGRAGAADAGAAGTGRPAQEEAFVTLVDRRAAREPVSHLVGHGQFYGREFLVTPEVLDPRPETETLIEVALTEPFATVLDLGTGTGCILLTLLAERQAAVGIGTDLSDAALERRLSQPQRPGSRRPGRPATGQLVRATGTTRGGFDLVVTNPPYIAVSEMPFLSPEVRGHEPRLALTDEADGLSAYRAILAGSTACCHRAGGWWRKSAHPSQGMAVSRLFRRRRAARGPRDPRHGGARPCRAGDTRAEGQIRVKTAGFVAFALVSDRDRVHIQGSVAQSNGPYADPVQHQANIR